MFLLFTFKMASIDELCSFTNEFYDFGIRLCPVDQDFMLRCIHCEQFLTVSSKEQVQVHLNGHFPGMNFSNFHSFSGVAGFSGSGSGFSNSIPNFSSTSGSAPAFGSFSENDFASNGDGGNNEGAGFRDEGQNENESMSESESESEEESEEGGKNEMLRRLKLISRAFEDDVLLSVELSVYCSICSGVPLIPDNVSVMYDHLVSSAHLAAHSQLIGASEKVMEFVSDDPNVDFIGNSTLRCIPCHKNFKVDQYVVNFKRHLSSDVHKTSCDIESRFKLIFQKTEQTVFLREMLLWLVFNNIPFHKVIGMTPFLQNYFSRFIPNERFFRRKLNSVKEEFSLKISSALKDQEVWLSIDETSQDGLGQVVAVVVGTLVPNAPEKQKTFLLDLVKVKSWRTEDVISVFNSSIRKLWPENEANNRHRLRLLVTDRGSQMVAAAMAIQRSNRFPNMKFVSCLCHSLDNFCDEIAKVFPNVTRFCQIARSIFSLSNDRKSLWYSLTNNLRLPLQLSQTRWGYFLKSVNWHHANWNVSYPAILQIALSQNTTALQELHSAASFQFLKGQIGVISNNFGFIESIITRFQSRNISFQEVDQLFQNVEDRVMVYSNSKEPRLFQLASYFQVILDRNSDFNDIRQNINLPEYTIYKNAPMVSVECERVFSSLDYIYSDRRRSFEFENLKDYLFIYVNSIHLGYRKPSR